MAPLIRISFDLNSVEFLVERGRVQKVVSISSEEQKELDYLQDQLEPYGDFTAFRDMTKEEIDKVTKMKKRRAELEGKTEAMKTVWDIAPMADSPLTVVLVLRPDYLPTYVENLPNEWINRLFAQQLIIENPQIYLGRPGAAPSPEPRATEPESTYQTDPNLTRKHNKVLEVIGNLDPSYLEQLDISQQGEAVSILPKKFLGEIWSPIDAVLTKQFGESAQWISKGKGDKNAHWEVL